MVKRRLLLYPSLSSALCKETPLKVYSVYLLTHFRAIIVLLKNDHPLIIYRFNHFQRYKNIPSYKKKPPPNDYIDGVIIRRQCSVLGIEQITLQSFHQLCRHQSAHISKKLKDCLILILLACITLDFWSSSSFSFGRRHGRENLMCICACGPKREKDKYEVRGCRRNTPIFEV